MILKYILAYLISVALVSAPAANVAEASASIPVASRACRDFQDQTCIRRAACCSNIHGRSHFIQTHSAQQSAHRQDIGGGIKRDVTAAGFANSPAPSAAARLASVWTWVHDTFSSGARFGASLWSSRGFAENLAAGFIVLVIQLAILDVLLSRATNRQEARKWVGVRRAIFDRLRLSLLGTMSSYWRVEAISRALDYFVVEFSRQKRAVWNDKEDALETLEKSGKNETPGFWRSMRDLLTRRGRREEPDREDTIWETPIDQELDDRIRHDEIIKHLEGLVPEALTKADRYFFTDYDWYRQELQLLAPAIDSDVSRFISTHSNLLNKLQQKFSEGFGWLEKFRVEQKASYYELDPRFTTVVFMPHDIYLELRGVCDEIDELFRDVFMNFLNFSKYLAEQPLGIGRETQRRAREGRLIVPLNVKRGNRFRLTFEYAISRGQQAWIEQYYSCADDEMAREIRSGIGQMLSLMSLFRNVVEILYFKRYKLEPSEAMSETTEEGEAHKKGGAASATE